MDIVTDAPPDLMTADETAAYLRIPVATLRDWRKDGKGPRGARIGRRVVWRRRDVEAWVAARFEDEGAAQCSTTSEAV